MSNDVNNVVYIGRFTADPLFTPARKDGTEDQKDRCWAIIASNPPTKHPNAKAAFMAVVAFGNRARIMAKYGKKGKGWGVIGSLNTRREELAEGGYKNYVEISVARNIMGADAKQQGAEEGAGETSAEGKKPDLKKVAQALVDLGYEPDKVEALLNSQEKRSDAPF